MSRSRSYVKTIWSKDYEVSVIASKSLCTISLRSLHSRLTPMKPSSNEISLFTANEATFSNFDLAWKMDPNDLCILYEDLLNFYGPEMRQQVDAHWENFQREEALHFIREELVPEFTQEHLKALHGLYVMCFPVAAELFPTYEFYNDCFYGHFPTRLEMDSMNFAWRDYKTFILKNFDVFCKPLAKMLLKLTLNEFVAFQHLASYLTTDDLIAFMSELTSCERHQKFIQRDFLFPEPFKILKYCSRTVRFNLLRDFFANDEGIDTWMLGSVELDDKIWENDAGDYKGVKTWYDAFKKQLQTLEKHSLKIEPPDTLEYVMAKPLNGYEFFLLHSIEDFFTTGQELKLCIDSNMEYYHDALLGKKYCYIITSRGMNVGLVSIEYSDSNEQWIVSEISGPDNVKIFNDLEKEINEKLRSENARFAKA